MKPTPYLWEEARKIMGYEFANSVMIGDRFWADILGAKRLGMRTVKVDQGGHCQETSEEAYRKNAAVIPDLFPGTISSQEAGRLMTPDATVKGLIELETVLAAFARE
jgi:FMN phosphatase YigB (HAD superfamily)